MKRETHTIDATNKSVGRIATSISILLRGKNKPEYSPNIDGGDIVYVENIDKLKFTGKKLEQKKYHSYSGYPGGLKERSMSEIYKNDPAEVLKRAVREMLPPVKFRTNMMKRLIIK